jgi:hypothetical protein
MGVGQPEGEATVDMDESDSVGGDEGQPEMDAVTALPGEGGGTTDNRIVRPEPFEHTFGAQAHPAETATGDPSHSSAPASSSEAPEQQNQTTDPAPAQEPPPADPSATPEQ